MASSSGRGPRLKKLAKAIPDQGEVYAAIRALLKEETAFADYAIAIIGASLLERTLELAMLGRFVELTTDEQNQLFTYSNNGPLADFSSRIKIRFAMYLFGRQTREDLDLIRQIRNLFAHSPTILTFKVAEVAEACQSIRVIQSSKIEGAREQYTTACTTLAEQIISGVWVRTAEWDPRWATPKPPRDLP